MSEILSQSEIDALLQALNSGELNVQEMKEVEKSRKIKKYDFRNPQKIAKDQLRTLEIINENFLRFFQTFLSGYLRVPVKATIMSIDQFAYNEFNNAISNPAFLCIIDFKPLNGQILIDVSTNIVFTIIDRLLGGDGSEINESRAFTDIELSLMDNIMKKSMPLIKEAWSNVIEINPKLDRIEVNPQFAQIIPPNETIALLTIQMEIGQRAGMMNICIPYLLIEPILEKLSAKYWFSATKNKLSQNEALEVRKRILNTKVEVRAELGTAKVKVNEVINLQRGDVIKLDSRKYKEIKIKVGSNVKFMGNIGVSNNKMAIKITKVVKDGDNDG